MSDIGSVSFGPVPEAMPLGREAAVFQEVGYRIADTPVFLTVEFHPVEKSRTPN